jgi:hypothetical protein
MKTTLAVALFLVICKLSAFGQTAHSPLKLKTFSLPDEEFSVEVPEGFTYFKLHNTKNSLDSRGEFQGSLNRFYLFVDQAKKAEQFKQVVSFARSYKQTLTRVDFFGHKADKVEFVDNDGYYHRILIVETRARTFSLQVVSTGKDEATALRFINSFKIITEPDVDKGSSGADIFQVSRSTNTSETQVEEIENNYVDWRSPISKRPSSPSASQNSQIPTVKNETGFAVLSKASPKYNEFARFYNIQGHLLLRVTFGKDGIIGSISPVKKLPFGLVESSIRAARKIKFKAPIRDGEPFTIVKLVDYGFSFY